MIGFARRAQGVLQQQQQVLSTRVRRSHTLSVQAIHLPVESARK
jgi:hypothetical protein